LATRLVSQGADHLARVKDEQEDKGMSGKRSRRGRKMKLTIPGRYDRTIELGPKGRAAFDAQHEAFVAKFGREPTEADPVFFDPDKDEPTPMSEARLREVMGPEAMAVLDAREEAEDGGLVRPDDPEDDAPGRYHLMMFGKDVRVIDVDDPTTDLMERQLALFMAKFGREPDEDDPIFFDPDEDEPTDMDEARLREVLGPVRFAELVALADDPRSGLTLNIVEHDEDEDSR
jgi:hypothetical protein